jgi:ubiquinone/menaquinone biosynthesis C-methylase UbiE
MIPMNTLLNKNLMDFSKSIWKSAAEGGHSKIRANYYKLLWKQITNKNRGENYLDIGAGELVNSVTFGESFENTYAMDVEFSDETISWAKEQIPNIQVSRGDAHKLSFEDNKFDVVTMISVLEHLKYPETGLREAIRVLMPGGELVIQIQNKYFPIETHTGLVFVYYMPEFLRKWILGKIGYNWYFEAVSGFPTPGEVNKYIKDVAELKSIKEVVLPSEIIPSKIRFFYKIAVALKMLKIVPHSWLAVYTKK